MKNRGSLCIMSFIDKLKGNGLHVTSEFNTAGFVRPMPGLAECSVVTSGVRDSRFPGYVFILYLYGRYGRHRT